MNFFSSAFNMGSTFSWPDEPTLFRQEIPFVLFVSILDAAEMFLSQILDLIRTRWASELEDCI